MPGNDFAGLMQSSKADSAAVDSVASCELPNAAGLRGIVLMFDNRPCAAIGYNSESTETIAISEPVVFLDASEVIYSALCNQLLKQIKLRAAEQGAHRLHFLQQNATGASRFASLLPTHGFAPATEIQRWELTVSTSSLCPPPGDRQTTEISTASPKIRQCRAASDTHPEMISPPSDHCEFQNYDFAAADVGEDGELHRALTEILECSQDFTSQPLPTATRLLSRWQQMSASVWLCRVDHRIAGLITLGTSPATSPEFVTETIDSESRICIEYIGVVPEFRRRQIASLMIRRIPTLVNQKDNSPPNCYVPPKFRITAYSDVANCPAACLYQQSGFTPSGRMDLWCCDLNHALHQTEISSLGTPRE